MDLTEIGRCASQKGIHLVSTGDWTHPLWFLSIQNELKEVNEGIYELKKTHPDQKHKVRYMLTTELSSIYTQGGKTRRIHNVIFSPSIKTALKIITQLKKHGINLSSDGRPILGMSSKNLLELVLGIDPNCLLIPAHIWTPWFSLFGSKSGFDSIEECFGKENAKYIYGIETGLSSDPIMNWQIKELETRSILSSSDAHSGQKLGREATVFISNSNLKGQMSNLQIKSQMSNYSYTDIVNAIKQKPDGKLKIGYTIEFFPEEGKYHWTGHRTCNIKYSPKQEKEKGVICPVCKQPLTVGVESRVADLSNKLLEKTDLLYAKNSVGLTFVEDQDKKRRPFVSIIPLLEVLSQLHNGSPTKAMRAYEEITDTIGTEFDILLKIPIDVIEKKGGLELAKAIEKIRNRSVYVDPGYDGVFGVVKLGKDEKPEITPALF